MPQKRLWEELKQVSAELQQLSNQKEPNVKKALELIQKGQAIKTKLTPPHARQNIQSPPY
jgi:hypothetical protein